MGAIHCRRKNRHKHKENRVVRSLKELVKALNKYKERKRPYTLADAMEKVLEHLEEFENYKVHYKDGVNR